MHEFLGSLLFFIITGNILNYMNRITITYFESFLFLIKHLGFCYLWGCASGEEKVSIHEGLKNYILFNMKKFHISIILLNNTHLTVLIF